ncbi:MAG TPA: orotidine-5'-phosphate decarboxylase [Spirochaetia bacterium]|nr:orotidine-5'-phosphate decarboxylase [Spirochaetia bacterium]
MSTKGFFSLLNDVSRRNNSLLCIGLDPPLDVRAEGILEANLRIIDAVASSACAVKPNAAFYEARGVEGWEALLKTIRHAHARGLPVILDVKRGDISSTAEAYARACFDVLEADAVTASPLLGGDSVEGLSARADKGVFLLCHTSNPGARDVQELSVEGVPLYERIAAMACSWNSRGNIGLVVGATYAHVLAGVRESAPDLWFLLPGVGAQGGDLEASLCAGLDSEESKVLVNVSRAIWQATDPADAARRLKDRINACRGPRARRVQTGGPPSTLVEEIALGLHDLGAVRFGSFTLKSGQISPVYIDLRLLVSDPRLMATVALAMTGILRKLRFDRIAAIPYGGLPIGQAVALAVGRPLLYPRREVKEYGTRKAIEGTFAADETVVVLDDLITTGASKLEAMAPLTAAGLKVTDVVVLVDREQGGARELAAGGLTLHSLMTLSDLLEALVRRGRITDQVRTDVRRALAVR